MKKSLILFVCLVAAGLTPPTPSHAGKAFTEACPAPLEKRLQQAKQFLVRYQHRLADDFEIDARRKGQERRSERQILRRVEKIDFKCKRDKDCDTHTAVQSVVGGNTMRICAPDLYQRGGTGAPFYRVVEVVAHEFGHNAHIPKARAGQHAKRGYNDPDRVYQFGFFAAELAREVYGTGFPVGERRDPVTTRGLTPAWDIVLYPRKDYQGHPAGFVQRLDDRGGRLDFGRWRHRQGKMNDLRFVGRNNAATSIKINRGRWQVCTNGDAVENGVLELVSASVSNLRSIKMNDKITSIRYLGP